MKESRLYSFLDTKKGFAMHFLEGQKLINDIIKTHNVGPTAINYYKNTILTAQHMLTFLKPGESLGVYVDSETPYFRFKIEMGYQGTMRTLLLPEEFSEFPKNVTGVARVSKIFPKQNPYTSIVQLNETKSENVINTILEESYQTNSEVLISEDQDQSIMISKLPPTQVDKEGNPEEDISLKEFILNKQSFTNKLFKNHINDTEEIVEAFKGQDLNYLGSKEVRFHCPCSKNRMITNLLNLHHNDIEEVFGQDKQIEIRCDYCNSLYHISKADLKTVQ